MNDPEYVITVGIPDDVVRIKTEFDQRNTPARMFLTDAAQAPYLIDQLGMQAEGLEGTVPAIDPNSGFEQACFTQFGVIPNSFSATTWDAFLLAAYTLARNEYKHGWEWPELSLQKVVSGRGTAVSWNEVNKGIELILQGKRPDIEGASGPLEYDVEYGYEPLQTYYAHWQVKNGAFETVEVISSAEIIGGSLNEGVSVSQTRGSAEFGTLALLTNEATYRPAAKQDLQAIIVASSKDWLNYRHQSDALAVYNLLRNNGVTDDRIILLLVDDIAYSEYNPLPGVVRHIPGGENNRDNVQVDYLGEEVTAHRLLNIIQGLPSTDTPITLNTNEDSNIFIYMVGHGGHGELMFDFGVPLTSAELISAIDSMYKNRQYRQMMIVTETCFGEGLAKGLTTPGVLYFTGAAANEQSFGTNYDVEVKAWLADDFTHKLITTITRNPQIYVTDLYAQVYSKVNGSHVRLLNYDNFGDIESARMSDFIIP